MSNIFETILRMSISAALVVIALLVFRPILKKLPGGLCSLLWVMVAVRLLCPVLAESPYSLMPDSVTLAETVTKTPAYEAPLTVPPLQVQLPQETPIPSPSEPALENVTTAPKRIQPLALGGSIWLAGTAIMLGYFIVSYLRLKKRVAANVKTGERLYICDNISSPFIMGISSPKIYLPSYINESYRDVIVAHERAHIARCDHLQKALGYFILSLHWFNPFVWCAYTLFCKDIERACDERVINGKTNEYKKLYAETLLYFCTDKGSLAPCRVAFGEIDAKQRISKVIKYKKASLWVVLAGVLIGAVIALCLLTNPESEPDALPSSSQSDSSENESKTEDSVANGSYEADESTEASTSEESSDPDESTEVSAPQDTSQDNPRDTPQDKPTDTPSVPTPKEHLSLQSTRITPEGIYPNDDCRNYGKNDRIPVYIQVYDKERAVRYPTASHYIREAALTVWLCDSKGNKIDYVNTNSNGLARFEVFEGSYTVHFGGTDTYAAYTTDVFEAKHPLISLYSSPIRMFVATYKKASFAPCTVTVLDADTSKPVRNVHVTRYKYKDSGFYTDANGKVTLPPLIEHNGEGEKTCGLSFTCQGYISQSLEVDVFESNITVRLSRVKEHPYTVRIVDADTGEGVEGVWLILSDYADTSKVYTAVSGKDGYVSGMKTSNELALFPQVNLYYSAEGIPYELRTEKGKGIYTRLSIVLNEGSNEYTVYLKTDEKNQTVTLFW